MKGNWQQAPMTGPSSLVRHGQCGSEAVEEASSNVKVESEAASVVFSEDKEADEVEFSTAEPS